MGASRQQAHAAGANQQSDDDEHDTPENLATYDRHDTCDDKDNGKNPQ